MDGRRALRLWFSGLILAVLVALGALYVFAMLPVDLERQGTPATAPRETGDSPSFEAEIGTSEPTALATPKPTAAPAKASPSASAPAAPTSIPDAAGKPAALRRLSVTVMSEDGRPVPGASVQAWFRLSDAAVRRALDAPDPLEMAQRLAGHERPRNFETRRADPTWLPPLGSWTTDGAGAIDVRLPVSSVLLVAEQGSTASSEVLDLPDADSPEARESVTLKLAARGTLRGRVLETDGQPAAGVSVEFRRIELPGARRGRLPRPLLADADGRFSIEIDGDAFLYAEASRDLARTPEQSQRVPAGGTVEMELRFPGGFSVSGIVRGPDGAPVPGVPVSAEGVKIHGFSDTSGADGRFHIVLAQPCRVVLIAEADELVQEACVAATVSEAQPRAEVELRLGRTTHVAGRIVWEDGTPFTDGVISASPARPHFATAAESHAWLMNNDQHGYDNAVTKRDFLHGSGDFRIDGLPMGRNFRVSLFTQEPIVGRPALEDVPGGAEDLVLVVKRVQPGTDVLRGRVVDAVSRVPVSGCELDVHPWHLSTVPVLAAPVVSAADGSFRFEGLQPATEYGLSVEVVNYPPQKLGPFTASADVEIEVAIGRHATLDIQVVDERGQPAAASVQLMQPPPKGFRFINEKLESRATDAVGHLAWTDLSPGVWILEAVGADSRAAPAQVQAVGGQSTPVQLVLRAPQDGGRLAIRVSRADGSPCAGARIRATRYVDDATADLQPIHLGTAGADGGLVLEGLAAGNYMIRADAANVFIGFGNAIVADGQTASVDVRPATPK